MSAVDCTAGKGPRLKKAAGNALDYHTNGAHAHGKNR